MKKGLRMKLAFSLVSTSVITFVISILISLVSTASMAESPIKVVGATTVDLVAAKKLFDAGSVFIDVRDTRAWCYGNSRQTSGR